MFSLMFTIYKDLSLLNDNYHLVLPSIMLMTPLHLPHFINIKQKSLSMGSRVSSFQAWNLLRTKSTPLPTALWGTSVLKCALSPEKQFLWS